MSTRFLPSLFAAGAMLLAAGCATTSSEETTSTSESRRASTPANSDSPESASRTPVTATETAAAERRASSSSTREGGAGSPAEMAKLVDQLNEAARELATLRTANAKMRAERARPGAEPAPAPKADPAEERLASSLKSYAQFRQDVTNLIGEVERLKKANADLNAEMKTITEQARQSRSSVGEVDRLKKANAEMTAEVRTMTDQMRQAKSALARVEDDLRMEKRSRVEAEAKAAQVREQLRTIARAMADAGLNADKPASQAEGAGARGRGPTKYVVREGDTLMKIADRVYGDAEKWRPIMEANRGRIGADGALDVGTELQIPRN